MSGCRSCLIVLIATRDPRVVTRTLRCWVVTELGHGCTSTNHDSATVRGADVAEGLSRPRGYGLCNGTGRGYARTARTTRVSGPW